MISIQLYNLLELHLAWQFQDYNENYSDVHTVPLPFFIWLWPMSDKIWVYLPKQKLSLFF